MGGYIKLGIAALLPVVFAAFVYLAEKKTPFGKMRTLWRQIIIGVLFGALAVVGTECGIPINGAQVNCRDAAVLTAGLMFGGPAGIIAGVIGGVERWIAVAWGVGSFTRVACTLSTIIAGFYAALLRRFLFENKKPGWLISFAIGVVMEVFHLTMVFITNMADATAAMAVVRACTAPMVVANGLSVMLASVTLTLLSSNRASRRHTEVRISQTVQRWLLVTVALAFVATSYFVFSLQNTIADRQTTSMLDLAIDEVADDIHDASDAKLLEVTRKIAEAYTDGMSFELLGAIYRVAEINLVDADGFIAQSTNPGNVNFDMSVGVQSGAFCALLGETKEMVQDYGPISLDSDVYRKYAGVKTPDGFIQVGYDAVDIHRDTGSVIGGITKNRHAGSEGYVLIFDENLNAVSTPAGMDAAHARGVSANLEAAEENTTFRATISGTECFCRYRITEGYRIVSVLPVSEAFQMRNIALYVNTFMEILVFAILFGLIYLLIKRVVVDQIKTINRSLSKITDGDLDVVVNVRTSEEFASLSDDINSTVDTLKRYISEASARIDKELEFAKSIQASALPNVFPAFPKHNEFDIYATMHPAREVGGDFYDFYLTNDDTLHFLVADVSGKGIPAAMFMMRAKTELKTLTESGIPLSDVFTRGNAALCEGNDAGMFVTAWQGSVNLADGKLQYANAGHNPPVVRRGDGKFEFLRSRAGFVLAGMDGVPYKEMSLDLAPGDVVFLYTDGVTEAQNANAELFGEERLLSTLNACATDDMHTICDAVKAAVDAFVDDAPQFDDITMVAFRYRGTPPIPTISFDEVSLADIPAVTEFVESELEKIDCPMKTIMQMNIAVDEIYSNIVKYAYPKKKGPASVRLLYKEDERTVFLRFSDKGIPYNPLTKEDPDITLSADERSIGGLGIFMVKQTMDEMKYKYEDDQNILTIVKKI